MAFTFDAERLKTALGERGFDASTEDGVVSGRLDEGAVRQVWIDAGGTLRLQLTRMLDEGETERLTVGDQAYKLSRERQEIVNVWTDLASVDGLGDILDQAEDLARHPAKPAEASLRPASAPVPLPASAPLPGEPGSAMAPAESGSLPSQTTTATTAASQPPSGVDAHPEASTDAAPSTADETRLDDTPTETPTSLAEVVANRVNQLVTRRTKRRKPR
ncbi:MAG: hypothetical protein KIT87_05905 [Anaerolineae bacterium]|nr:hypothetical protein [Anaerolineae bacterium]